MLFPSQNSNSQVEIVDHSTLDNSRYSIYSGIANDFVCNFLNNGISERKEENKRNSSVLGQLLTSRLKSVSSGNLVLIEKPLFSDFEFDIDKDINHFSKKVGNL